MSEPPAGETDIPDSGYPEEGPPGAAPDDTAGDDSAVRERSQHGAEDAPDNDDGKATGNPNT